MEELRKEALKVLAACEDRLRFMRSKLGAEFMQEDDLNDAYFGKAGHAWAFQKLGLISYDEALTWISRFARAAEGVDEESEVAAVCF